jgi:hypothetical protein
MLDFNLVDFSVSAECLLIYGLNGLASKALIFSLSSFDIVGSSNNRGKILVYNLCIFYTGHCA